MVPLRLVALATLCMIASACDSGPDEHDAPNTPNVADLVGTWDFQSGRAVSYITISQAQSARDPSRPGTGGLTVTGDLTGTFRYFGGRISGTETISGFLSDTRAPGEASVLTLLVGKTPGRPPDVVAFQTLDPARPEDTVYNLVSFSGAAPFTFTEDAFEITSARFASSGSDREATISGRLVFARVAVPANRESIVSNSPYRPDYPFGRTVTFGEGSAYSQTNRFDQPTTGTWIDLGNGRIGIRLGQAATTAYTFGIDGSVLTLTSEEPSNEPSDPEFGQRTEQFYGLIPGTLVSARDEETRTFVRSASNGTRQ